MLLIAIDHITNINIKFVMLISRIKSVGWNLYLKYGFIDDPIVKLNNSNKKSVAIRPVINPHGLIPIILNDNFKNVKDEIFN